MRTNIEIDDKLMKQAMKATGAKTKRETVEASLRKVVQLKAQTRIRNLFGKGVWRGHDDDWFASDEEILKKRRMAKRDAEPEGAHLPAADQPVIPAEAC
jgi:Arc/MetJ family transcription regulator